VSTRRTVNKPISCSTIRAAPAAIKWLLACAPSRPFHIFETVCNLINAQGNLLSLTLFPAEMNPLSLEIKCQSHSVDFREHIQIDGPVQIELTRLVVGDLSIHLNSPDIWPASPDWHAVRRNRQDVARMLDVIQSLLSPNHSPESLAVLLDPSALYQEAPAQAWLRRSVNPIKALLNGLEMREPDALRAAAANLAGLGPGLTPGGDDFIIGVMYALWSTRKPAQVAASCSSLLKGAAGRTNALSSNYLGRAAVGEAAQPWHALIAAMAHGEDTGLKVPVDALIKLGHTSGQDALSGFVLAATHILGKV
jgi:hypothetical protein